MCAGLNRLTKSLVGARIVNHSVESKSGTKMKYNILLTKVAGSGYVARPMQWPEVVAAGEDEAKALVAVRKALTEFLANSKIVEIDLPAVNQPTEDPWLKFAGMWSDIPDDQWERFQASIADARQMIDRQQEILHNETTD